MLTMRLLYVLNVVKTTEYDIEVVCNFKLDRDSI